MANTTRRAVAVLAGGGGKAAFQMAAERVLRESGAYTWTGLFGVSAGALNAALLCREAYDELRDIWLHVREQDVFRRFPWYRVALRIAQGKTGIYDNTPLRALIDKHIQGKPVRIPCQVGYVDLPSGGWHLAAPTTDAVWASATMPGFFEAVGPGGLVDGGLRNVTPLSAAVDALGDADEVVVITCNPRGCPPAPMPRNLLQVAERALDILESENSDGDLRETLRINDLVGQAEAQGAHLVRSDGRRLRHVPITVVEPAESLGSTLDFSQTSIRRRMAAGEAAARAVLARKAAA